MKRFVLGVGALLGGWLWSRGARNPLEWPKRLPQELGSLWDDIDEAFSAGRRAADRQERAFEDEMRRVRSDRD